MDVLVTGGCGYIGSALLPQLQVREAIDDVRVLDNLVAGSPRNLIGSRIADGFEFRRGDVREYGDVESAMRGADAVIHLAAITGAESTHNRREETFAINYDGAENVFTAAEKLGVDNVVFASSCNIYGRTASSDIDESTDSDPLNPYAEAKYEAEQLLADYLEDGAFDGTALRMSTNYGYAPGVRFNLVVNLFVFRALTDRALTVYGDGSNWRPFIHVQDAAQAFVEATTRPSNWSNVVYNVGSNSENYRIAEIADIVREEVSRNLEITYLEDEHPGPSYHVDFSRLQKTGFETDWTLRDGIRDLAEKFRTGADSTIAPNR